MNNNPTIPSIIFFGSSKYSTIVAESLNKKFALTLAVTAPDKPTGRERKLAPNPVKKFAGENNIEVLTTRKLDQTTADKIAAKKCDFLVVDDYGQIIPGEILALPKFAPLNVHHSVLPRYRGPSPAPSAILAGEKVSGVTIIMMTDKVDAGPILAQKEYQLESSETTDSLLTKLNTKGAEILIDVIDDYLRGNAKPIDQDESRATLTNRFTKEDGHINLENPPGPEKLDRMIRAFYPWPGVWTEIESRVPSTRLRASKSQESRKLRLKLLPNLPTILPAYHPTDQFLIQPEGKRPLTISQFRNGYPQAREQIENLIRPQLR